MRPWLRGDLTGVDVRLELPRIRDVAMAAAHRGDDLRPLFGAVAVVDPVACAELAAGPRAIAHPVAVTGALSASDALEQVLAPSGLYARLIELAPTLAVPILTQVAHRHLDAPWAGRLFRRSDPRHGALHLEVAVALGALERVARVHAREGNVSGLVAFAEATGSVEPMAALWRVGALDGAVRAAAAALLREPEAPVIAGAGALGGPDVRAFATALLARVGDPAAGHVRRSLAVGPLPVR